MNRSLRSQLLLGIAATTVIVFLIVAITTFALLRRSLLHEYDALLGGKARALATLIEQNEDGVEIDFHDHPMHEFARKVRPEYYQVWTEDGRVLARSRRLTENDLDCPPGSLYAPRFRFVTLPDGRPGRIAAVEFLPAVEGETLEHPLDDETDGPDSDEVDQVDFSARVPIRLAVARETAQIDQALAKLKWILAGVSVTAVTAMLGVLCWMVTFSLRPLRQLAARIATVDERELTSRFEFKQAPAELVPVVARLNELIHRLHGAFQRERTFTADVAHELRTPLAGLRATLQVALSRPRDNDEYRRTLANCDQICEDTQRLVDTLLSLARIDGGRVTIERRRVDVQRLLLNTWQPFAANAEDRHLSVSIGGPNRVVLATDEEQLRIVFSNLFDNAVEYADPHGSIRVECQMASQQLLLTVANSGCELNATQAERVFDRFWRADSARADTGLHAGLGLALCREIVQRLGGTINAECVDGQFKVRLEFTEGIVDASAQDVEQLVPAFDIQAARERSKPRPRPVKRGNSM